MGNSLLVPAITVSMIVPFHRAVVLEKQKYLERAFGDPYVRFESRIKRWL